MYDLEDRVNFAVFPALQGGPHNHIITAVAVCLHEAMSPEFVKYQQQVVANAKHFAEHMRKKGYTLATSMCYDWITFGNAVTQSQTAFFYILF